MSDLKELEEKIDDNIDTDMETEEKAPHDQEGVFDNVEVLDPVMEQEILFEYAEVDEEQGDSGDEEEGKEEEIREEEVEVELDTKKLVTDEVTVITEGTTLSGNIVSTGSVELQGIINGNVECNGTLTVTGMVHGNTTSAEFFANAAKIEGEILAEGGVKIGVGSVIIGNITATSAIIAGAIKGDIDVDGSVIVDSSAVVVGNIKSRSVQINNGAVIEGFFSQSYAEVDVSALFEEM